MIKGKVRKALEELIPYLVIVGERDAAAKTMALRTREKEQGTMTVEAFVERCKVEISSRSVK